MLAKSFPDSGNENSAARPIDPMEQEHPKTWFFRKLSREAFLIFSLTWLLLFLMELVKDGMVSRYVSLPQSALVLLVLAILALSLQPPQVDQPKRLEMKDVGFLIIASVVLALVFPVAFDFSGGLTALFIFVTVLTLWIGTIALKEL